MPNYVPTIMNDEVSAMEAIRFEGETIVVDTMELLAEACDFLSHQQLIGFDTETRPSFTAGVINRVSLLQLYAAGRCFLIRLNRVPFHKRLIAILSDEQKTKVGVGVQNDILGLNSLRHFTARGFIDLQNEVGNYGIEEKSLRKISAIVLGKRVSKAQRLSNWEAKVLTAQQILYAATDAWVCVEILNTLRQQ